MNWARRCFYQYANHLPNHLLSIKLKYPDFSLPLFDLIRFILYYFVQTELFHADLHFQKETNFKETLCLQPRQLVSISLYLRLYAMTVHLPDFAGDKNIHFEFPNACLLGHPFNIGYQYFKS